jgi:hypothetical protein
MRRGCIPHDSLTDVKFHVPKFVSFVAATLFELSHIICPTYNMVAARRRIMMPLGEMHSFDTDGVIAGPPSASSCWLLHRCHFGDGLP